MSGRKSTVSDAEAGGCVKFPETTNALPRRNGSASYEGNDMAYVRLKFSDGEVTNLADLKKRFNQRPDEICKFIAGREMESFLRAVPRPVLVCEGGTCVE